MADEGQKSAVAFVSDEVQRHVSAIEEATAVVTATERKREIAQTALSLAIKASTGEQVLELRAIVHLVHALDEAKQRHQKADAERTRVRHAVPGHLAEAVGEEIRRRMGAWLRDADRIGPPAP